MMAQLVYEIKSTEGKENLADIAVKALHKASQSMRQLISLLRQAERFWNQLREHCQRLADDRILSWIEMFVKGQIKDYWTSNEFKQKMFRYYCKWAALHSVTATYFEQIMLTQQDLYNFMNENPTYEESRRWFQDFVQDFEEDLMWEDEQIEEQNFKTDKEIEQLKSDDKKDAEQKIEL